MASCIKIGFERSLVPAVVKAAASVTPLRLGVEVVYHVLPLHSHAPVRSIWQSLETGELTSHTDLVKKSAAIKEIKYSHMKYVNGF